jgi:cytochrome c551/c552
MSPEEAANRWISENQAVWKQWMPTCAGYVKLNETKAVKTKVAATVDASALAKSKNCTACHGIENTIVGPAFKDIAAKYKGNKTAVATLVAKVKNGGAGNWGEAPMPPNPSVSDADTETLVTWILSQ